GGAGQDALLAEINLAQPLQNGMQIYVPAEGDSARVKREGELISTPGSSQSSDAVRVNEASIAELEQLPGIGPSLAAAIIQYRDENGPFQSKEEIQDVPGIGPAKLSAIEDLIQVP
ncbi:MAG: helix-hairpin-helix domain-containing protein, partial [Anaerolineales bacterium]|nr:helix-hairpin-helix domain-containing protein [Anaerolineales bacterium]